MHNNSTHQIVDATSEPIGGSSDRGIRFSFAVEEKELADPDRSGRGVQFIEIAFKIVLNFFEHLLQTVGYGTDFFVNHLRQSVLCSLRAHPRRTRRVERQVAVERRFVFTTVAVFTSDGMVARWKHHLEARVRIVHALRRTEANHGKLQMGVRVRSGYAITKDKILP